MPSADQITAFEQAVEKIGLLAILIIGLLIIAFFIVRSLTVGSKQNGELMNRLAGLLDKETERLNALQQVVVQGHAQIDVLTQTLTETSAAKEAAIKQNAETTKSLQEIVKANTEALIENRVDYLARWEDALKKMGQSSGTIIFEVNANTDRRAGEMGDKITGVQDAFTTQHAGQDAGVKALMEESEKRINEHVDQKVDRNGDATRELIIERLNSINERLDAMQQKAEQRDSQMAKQLHQLSADLSSTLLLITAPKVDVRTDAGTPPPVDIAKKELD